MDEAAKLIQYHLRRERVMSTTGPHKNRHRLADRPRARIPAIAATENPCCFNTQGRAIVINPWLMPVGNIRKKKYQVLVVYDSFKTVALEVKEWGVGKLRELFMIYDI
jgi:hypothetical protein